jgi:hypothetical protein
VPLSTKLAGLLGLAVAPSGSAHYELFYKACQVAGYYPEHSGTEVLWSYAYERTVPYIASQLGAES